MLNKEQVIATLRADQGRLRIEYHVASLALFGSFARGQQSSSSDIDVLVDFSPGASLFDLNGLGNDLTEKLGVRVDVVPRSSLRKEFRQRVLEEAIQV